MSRTSDVREKVSIPQYFYNIIVPQLGSYYSNYPVDFDAKPVACCPLHDEDTPSMRFYEETNTFYCFGCRKGGDIINLHRLFMERQNGSKPSFKEAVDFLYEYFIRGNEAAQSIKPQKKLIKDVKLNSETELIKYCKYSNFLESQLLIDTSVSEETKRKLWKALDDTEILIDTNNLNASEAMNYIQSIIKENIK